MEEVNGLSCYYWYVRDRKEHKPRITVCFAVDFDTGLYARGVSVCSQPDNPDKSVGRQHARARARIALEQKSSSKTKVYKKRSKTFPLHMKGAKKKITKYAKYFEEYMPAFLRPGETWMLEKIRRDNMKGQIQ